jgi:hypothetical protein
MRRLGRQRMVGWRAFHHSSQSQRAETASGLDQQIPS